MRTFGREYNIHHSINIHSTEHRAQHLSLSTRSQSHTRTNIEHMLMYAYMQELNHEMKPHKRHWIPNYWFIINTMLHALHITSCGVWNIISDRMSMCMNITYPLHHLQANKIRMYSSTQWCKCISGRVLLKFSARFISSDSIYFLYF